MSAKPLIIGHRGASSIAPENTMSAFRLALEAGADGIELDVRLTRDGVPVVIHDDNLSRTGSTSERVAELSLAELRKIDVGSWFKRASGWNKGDFLGEKVPTLEEVFELLESTSAILYLEMKSDAVERNELAKVCCKLLQLRRRSLKDRVIVECFDLAGIAAVKGLDADIKTAALFDRPWVNLQFLSAGRRMVDQALAVAADEIALHYKLATEKMVNRAQSAGLKVAVWTVDDATWIQRAASIGITTLITNDPGMMIRQRDNAGLD